MSTRPPRVLVVDDEADLRELLELSLLKIGLEVDRAATLAAARALLTQARTAQARPLAPDAAPLASRLTGDSAPMRALRAHIARLARSMAPVAICGESGSGKELAAREIHALGARAERPFIAVNCGAIPEALMEAEFFGYRKGAFTGASGERDGLFQAAAGGTLLLDEVAELPPAMQVKLLRAVQERRVRKLGATTEQAVDVRIISATHKNLARCVEQGSFRQDLFYRLNVIELRLPPLRERLDDLPALTSVILGRLAAGGQVAVPGPGVMAALRAHSFPGNVRELENILERAQAFCDNGVISVADLALGGDMPPPPSSAPSSAVLPANLPDYLRCMERDIIVRALAQTAFNRVLAARLLGISARQLRYQIQKLKIQEPDA